MTVHSGHRDFAQATTIAPIPGQPGEFMVELDAGWLSLVGVPGGYIRQTKSANPWRSTGSRTLVASTGGLAVEHGVIATVDGTLVAESFQTRLAAQD